MAALGPARFAPVAPVAAQVSDGRPLGPDPYRVVVELGREAHVSAIRARFRSTISGVPTRYQWEVRRCGEAAFEPIAGASESHAEAGPEARRRTWFVDTTG